MPHDGIFRMVMQGQGRQRVLVPAAITITPLVVSKLFQHRDEIRYELRWKSVTGEVRSTVAAAGDIADSRKLTRIFDEAVVISKSASDVSEYLQLAVEANKTELVARSEVLASQLGWQDDGSFIFGPGRPQAVHDSKNTHDWLPSHRAAGSFSGWRDAAWRCAPSPVALAMIAASLAAPLLRIISAKPFLVGVDNSTSSGKTTGLRLAASVWGSPADGHLIRSWRDTVIASEHRISMLRGMPYFLDETQHTRDKPGVIADFIYALSEGHSKARSNQQGTALTGDVTYETVVITSGERSLSSFTSQGGIMPRVVTLTGKPMTSPEMALQVEELVTENYGHTGELWLRAVAMAAVAELRQRYSAISESLRKAAVNPVQGRRAGSVAVMQLAAELAFSAELMPPIAAEVWPYLVGGGGALEENSDDPALRALMLLGNFIAADPRSFWSDRRGRGIMDMIAVQPAAGWAGRYQPGEYLAVRPEWLRAQLRNQEMDWDAVKGSWRERGWLELPGGARSKHLTKTVAIDGMRALCVVVSCPELLDMLAGRMI
jgi:hypothetical protein